MNKSLKVGDKIKFKLVDKLISGLIVEDRGNLGLDKRQIFSIEFVQDGNKVIVELPADELL